MKQSLLLYAGEARTLNVRLLDPGGVVSNNSFDLLPIDRRARRTRALLADALLELGAVHDIDGLDVGEIAAAAGVGRSTFYTHYAGKDDFLIASFVNLLVMAEEAVAAKYPNREDIVPSGPLFVHMAEAGDFARNVAKSAVFPQQMTAGEAKLRSIAETNIARRMPHWPEQHRRETAIYIASGFIGLLRWWMTSGLKQSPEQMQRAFFRLSQSALSEAAGSSP